VTIHGRIAAVVARGASLTGPASGSLLPQGGGSAIAFTGGLVSNDRRAPRSGRSGEVRLERDLTLPASGVAAVPLAGDRITFTGDAREWSIAEVDPVGAGGTHSAWRLSLRDWANENDE
jgi:hypothetical protein